MNTIAQDIYTHDIIFHRNMSWHRLGELYLSSRPRIFSVFSKNVFSAPLRYLLPKLIPQSNFYLNVSVLWKMVKPVCENIAHVGGTVIHDRMLHLLTFSDFAFLPCSRQPVLQGPMHTVEGKCQALPPLALSDKVSPKERSLDTRLTKARL